MCVFKNLFYYCVSYTLFVCILAIAWRVYLKLRNKPLKCYQCLVGKTVIITGGNTGIGYITALDLAQRGAKVILACRCKEKAHIAVINIIKLTQNPNVSYKLLDLKSFESVRNFAKEINEKEDKIDILINNAGVGGIGNKFSEDGNQMTMQVNYLSHFLLTHLLIDKLKKATPSRIINLSSIAAKFGKINPENLNEYPENVQENIARMRMYSASKLCIIYFTLKLAEKLKGSGVTANVVHPGTVKTEIFRRVPYEKLVKIIASLYFKTPEEGARTTIFLAASKLVENISGKLYDNCTQIELYSSARNPEFEEKIWEKTESLVSLEDKEKL